MPLYLKEKQEIVADVAEIANSALSVVAVDYRGLSSPNLTELRAKARELNVNLRIVRNTLAKRAVKGTIHECLDTVLTGPIMLAFAIDEPGVNARLIRDFVKDNDNLEVKALSISGKLLDGSKLDTIANLPTKDEAIARLMSCMQAPIAKFVRTFAEPKAKLVRTIVAIRDKKESEAA